MTGYIGIGRGIGAAIVDGYPMLVAGPVFAQIERERRDGPRYIEALTGARALRREFIRQCQWGPYRPPTVSLIDGPSDAATLPIERERGIPYQWHSR